MPPPFHGTGTKKPKRTTPVSGSSLEIENLEDGGEGRLWGEMAHFGRKERGSKSGKRKRGNIEFVPFPLSFNSVSASVLY